VTEAEGRDDVVTVPKVEEKSALVEEVTLEDIQIDIHVHVWTASQREDTQFGGSMVLWELHDTIAALNVSVTDNSFHDYGITCPSDEWLAEPISNNKTIVIVYPEVHAKVCKGQGHHVHIWWILAPLGTAASRETVCRWGKDDMVFHHSTDTASMPNLPISNILQSMQSPQKGDENDVSPEVFHNKEGRSGIAWMLRKAQPFIEHLKFVHEGHGMETTQMETIENVTDFLKYEYFLSYDPYTFHSFSTAMVGTVSITSPVPGLSKQDWILGSFVSEYIWANSGTIPGIAYGMDPEEVEYVRHVVMKGIVRITALYSNNVK
jgi:hypothetical protein